MKKGILAILIFMCLAITCVGALTTGDVVFTIAAIISVGIIAWKMKQYVDENSGGIE